MNIEFNKLDQLSVKANDIKILTSINDDMLIKLSELSIQAENTNNKDDYVTAGRELTRMIEKLIYINLSINDNAIAIDEQLQAYYTNGQ